MKGSDFIVAYLAAVGVRDVFGYPGGMVTHIMDSLSRQGIVRAHVCAHEQGAAFEACGYAQASGGLGVAYATSGPGATNLVTGVCNAWFDSIPVLFITGQVNTFESAGDFPVRQRGFQETDVVGMVRGVTKWAHYVSSPNDLAESVEKAVTVAREGRKGPVLLDVPMDVQRGEVPDQIAEATLLRASAGWIRIPGGVVAPEAVHAVGAKIRDARRPCILIGSGVKQAGVVDLARELCNATGIPAACSMPAVDALAGVDGSLGFVGAYGSRAANFAVARCDLLLVLGSRLDVRQVGARRGEFAPGAEIVRVDVDEDELAYPVRDGADFPLKCDVYEFLRELLKMKLPHVPPRWLEACRELRSSLSGLDDLGPNRIVRELSGCCPDDAVIVTDVGQNQVWVAQSFEFKPGQTALFSVGHGAMGYSLPAAAGAAISSGRPVVCFTGDGGLQMNMQELALVARERLPVTVVAINNRALGMIRHFQEMYLDSNYTQTVEGMGYGVPDFSHIAAAYGIPYERWGAADGRLKDGPRLVEVAIEGPTYVAPKLRFGVPNQDQDPPIERGLYSHLMEITSSGATESVSSSRSV